jgi:hypothetical protein
MRLRSFFSVVSIMTAFASCDRPVSPAPETSHGSTPAAKDQTLQQRERKSSKVGFDAGARDGIQWVGMAEYQHRLTQVPSKEKLNQRIRRALTKAQKSAPDLDAASFRSGYVAGFGAVVEEYAENKSSAW